MSEKLPDSIRLKVITPRKLLVDEEVKEVTLPDPDRCLGILPGHRPLFVALGKGTLSYRIQRKKEKYSVRGGHADIGPQKVEVFTELAEDETG
ncbi:hypothetical protein KGY73_06960 [bacterium]|nr:hypothetical protein [bacterium]